MSYLSFHLIFLLPPILGMLFLHRRPLEGAETRASLALPVICIIALSYTTPWDNYLVAKEIWWYGPDRVIATIGYVPIEEYLFFILQPLLTGLFLFHYLGRYKQEQTSPSTWAPWIGAGVFLAFTFLGAYFLMDGRSSTLYLALILVWAPPILAGMWLYDGVTLWALRRTLVVTTGLPTLYLWVADAVAIHNQIWTISAEYTIGLSPFGLPLEEASFFFFTNLLVVQGVILLLYGSHKVVTADQNSVLQRPSS